MVSAVQAQGPTSRLMLPPPRGGLWGTGRGQGASGKLTIVHGDHVQDGGDRGLQGNSRLYMVITCRQLRSCRLYSWIRFTWTSNMEDGLIFTLYSLSRNCENFILFSCGEWTGQSSLRQKPWLSAGAHTLSSKVRAERSSPGRWSHLLHFGYLPEEHVVTHEAVQLP